MSIIRRRRPSDPGRLLKQYYLDSQGITILALAERTRVSRKHISSIVNGRAPISADMATRFAAALGTTAQFWLNLQNAVDLYDAAEKISSEPIELLRPQAQLLSVEARA